MKAVSPLNNSPHLQAAHKLSRTALEAGTSLRLQVTSQSMFPLLKIGDHVIVKTATSDDFQRGDIIVIQQSGGFLAHRLIGVDAQGFHAKGDNTFTLDAPVPHAQILGRVTTIESEAGRINLQARHWRAINCSLGWLGTWEARIIQNDGRVKKGRSNDLPTGVDKLATKLLVSFFRIIIRLLFIKETISRS